MKQIVRKSPFLIAVLALMVLGLCVPVHSKTAMSLAYMEHWYPISFRTDQGSMQGILIDITTEALNKRLGIPISHHGYPWIRAQAYVEGGKHDAMVTTPTEVREKYGLLGKEPVLYRSYSIYVIKGNPIIETLKSIDSLEDLKPYTLVDFLGNGWSMKYMDGKGYSINRVPTKDQIWQVLEAGRADYVLANPYATRVTLMRMGLTDHFVEIPTELPELNFYYVMIISRKSPFAWVLPKFDATLREMKADGTWERIVDKWYSKAE